MRVWLLLALLGCGPSQPLPEGAVAMEAPAWYAAWWERTEECSGLTGDFEAIDWYIIPGQTFELDGAEWVGHWIQNVGIVIAGLYRNHEVVVRHEMLHELLGAEGHPPEFDECRLTWETQ